MISLLKTFGKGLLYVIGAPFFVLALLIFGVIGLFDFIFQIFKSIIFFFTGQKFFPELAEDKELRLKLEAMKPQNNFVNENEQSIISPIYEETNEESLHEVEETPVVQRNIVEPTIEETVFDDTSSLEDLMDEEEIEPQTIQNEEIEEKIIPVETGKEEEIKEEEFEELETYVPRSSNTYTDIDEEEENTDSGVDINYDL